MGNSVINRGHTSLFYRTAKISEQAYPLLCDCLIAFCQIHRLSIEPYSISTQLSSYLICFKVSSILSIGGCLILNFIAFFGTWVWIVNCEP